MALEKVKAVLEWKSPTSLVETQSFLGFANVMACASWAWNLDADWNTGGWNVE